jgi:hypothetical protein
VRGLGGDQHRTAALDHLQGGGDDRVALAVAGRPETTVTGAVRARATTVACAPVSGSGESTGESSGSAAGLCSPYRAASAVPSR